MNFIQRFKAAWRIAKEYRYCEEADREGFFNDDDRLNTKLFFESVSGKKLSASLVNFAIKMAINAVQDPTGAQNGDARGVTACIKAIEMHFPQEEPSRPAHEVQAPEMETVEA